MGTYGGCVRLCVLCVLCVEQYYLDGKPMGTAFKEDVGDRWAAGLVPCFSFSPGQSVSVNVGQNNFRMPDGSVGELPKLLERYNAHKGSGEVQRWDSLWKSWETVSPGCDLFEDTQGSAIHAYRGALLRALGREQHVARDSTVSRGTVVAGPVEPSEHMLRFLQQSRPEMKRLLASVVLARLQHAKISYADGGAATSENEIELPVAGGHTWLRAFPQDVRYPFDRFMHDAGVAELLRQLLPLFEGLEVDEGWKADNQLNDSFDDEDEVDEEGIELGQPEEKGGEDDDDADNRAAAASQPAAAVRPVSQRVTAAAAAAAAAAAPASPGGPAELVAMKSQREMVSPFGGVGAFTSMVKAVLSSECLHSYPDLALLVAQSFRHLGVTVAKSGHWNAGKASSSTNEPAVEFEDDEFTTARQLANLYQAQNLLVGLDAVPLACELISQHDKPELHLEGLRLGNLLLLNLNQRAQHKFLDVLNGEDRDYPDAGSNVLSAVCRQLMRLQEALNTLRGEAKLKALWEMRTALRFLQSLCGKRRSCSRRIENCLFVPALDESLCL